MSVEVAGDFLWWPHFLGLCPLKCVFLLRAATSVRRRTPLTILPWLAAFWVTAPERGSLVGGPPEQLESEAWEVSLEPASAWKPLWILTMYL